MCNKWVILKVLFGIYVLDEKERKVKEESISFVWYQLKEGKERKKMERFFTGFTFFPSFTSWVDRKIHRKESPFFCESHQIYNSI